MIVSQNGKMIRIDPARSAGRPVTQGVKLVSLGGRR